MSTIRLVQGDNLPVITLTITDAATGSVIDLSAATTTVVVKLRSATGTAILSTLTCTKTNGGADGVVSFYFPTPTLTVAAGQYQGEIEMNFNGLILTVFDLLQFTVRAQFT
ncbi:hypothetical protein UFOVP285_10 [uncultured Caudovirales phage]|jgi:hypothetical protein|uniref:BppU N-terminal domain-containing protein n=1 Tax=uncultured Caudovirales phage TaxID=2100421 RepID=A0A6J5LLF5_9CAUD|nr:hypothetical protein UFOVP285_10 [uncultured Caudovirales phage]